MSTREAAHAYFSAGLPITLCPPDSKSPLGEGWTDKSPGIAWPTKRWTESEIDRAFDRRGDLNVGCLWGPASGLIDLEVDEDGADQALLELFDGDPPVTPTFDSRRGPHRLYAFDRRLEAIGKATAHYRGLEVKLGAGGKGSQSLLPPSVANGSTRIWRVSLSDCPPAHLSDRAIRRLLEACKPAEGTLHSVHRDSSDSVYLCKELEAAIARTLPSGHGHRRRQLFHFARAVKGIESTAKSDLQSLRPIVREWHRRALPTIRTQDFDETWADFAGAWSSIRYATGEGPIAMMFQRAIASPMPKIADRYDSQSLRALVALCCQLQIEAGEKPFFLACRSAAELLGVSHVLANNWLRLLTLEGVLEVAKPGTRHKATEFRYLGDVPAEE